MAITSRMKRRLVRGSRRRRGGNLAGTRAVPICAACRIETQATSTTSSSSGSSIGWWRRRSNRHRCGSASRGTGYLTTRPTADGKHDEYLDPTSESGAALRPLDPRLYDGLASVVASGERSVESLGAGRRAPVRRPDVRRRVDLRRSGRRGPSGRRSGSTGCRGRWRNSPAVRSCTSIPTTACAAATTRGPRGVPRRSSTPTSTNSPRSSGAARASSSPTTSTRRTRSASRSGA